MSSIYDGVAHSCKWHMRALQEILIDHILLESVQSVTNALGCRVLHLDGGLNFEVLLIALLLENLAFQDECGNVFLALR